MLMPLRLMNCQQKKDASQKRNESLGMVVGDGIQAKKPLATTGPMTMKAKMGQMMIRKDDLEDESDGLPGGCGWTAKAVGENTPAQPCDGEELGAGGDGTSGGSSFTQQDLVSA